MDMISCHAWSDGLLRLGLGLRRTTVSHRISNRLLCMSGVGLIRIGNCWRRRRRTMNACIGLDLVLGLLRGLGMILWSWSWGDVVHTRNRNEVHGTSMICTTLRIVLGPSLYIRVGISAVRIVNVGRTRLLLLGRRLLGLRLSQGLGRLLGL